MDFGFDIDVAGQSPAGWRAGVTGRGSPVWEVRQDPSAPSKPNVLQQSGSGTRIRVVLNGKVVIEMDDAHIKGAGAVGMWTKADSVTAFDDFSYDAK